MSDPTQQMGRHCIALLAPLVECRTRDEQRTKTKNGELAAGIPPTWAPDFARLDDEVT
jgi:hypothetical protein